MALRPETDTSPDDLAARAGWLYYNGGMTQDQIASELNVSRQRAQRLVARALSDGLVRVRIEHPIRECMELERELRQRFGLVVARVAPSLPEGVDPVRAISSTAASEIERIFANPEPLVVALGTGRTLRSAVEDMQVSDCSRHKLVSLIGNVAPDGSASFFEVIMRIAEKTHAPHYPMAMPVVAESHEARELYHAMRHVIATRELAKQADISIVGCGQMGLEAPMVKDGFMTPAEMKEMTDAGAVGEIVGWMYDENGHYLEDGQNALATGVRLPQNSNPVVCIAAGQSKYMPLRSALRGGIISGLVTDERTAKALLNQ